MVKFRFDDYLIKKPILLEVVSLSILSIWLYANRGWIKWIGSGSFRLVPIPGRRFGDCYGCRDCRRFGDYVFRIKFLHGSDEKTNINNFNGTPVTLKNVRAVKFVHFTLCSSLTTNIWKNYTNNSNALYAKYLS